MTQNTHPTGPDNRFVVVDMVDIIVLGQKLDTDPCCLGSVRQNGVEVTLGAQKPIMVYRPGLCSAGEGVKRLLPPNPQPHGKMEK